MLTNLLVNEIIAASPSRIVTVSSRAHRRGEGRIDLENPMLTGKYSRLEAYAQSKLANIIFSQELAKRLQGTTISF